MLREWWKHALCQFILFLAGARFCKVKLASLIAPLSALLKYAQSPIRSAPWRFGDAHKTLPCILGHTQEL